MPTQQYIRTDIKLNFYKKFDKYMGILSVGVCVNIYMNKVYWLFLDSHLVIIKC